MQVANSWWGALTFDSLFNHQGYVHFCQPGPSSCLGGDLFEVIVSRLDSIWYDVGVMSILARLILWTWQIHSDALLLKLCTRHSLVLLWMVSHGYRKILPKKCIISSVYCRFVPTAAAVTITTRLPKTQYAHTEHPSVSDLLL